MASKKDNNKVFDAKKLNKNDSSVFIPIRSSSGGYYGDDEEQSRHDVISPRVRWPPLPQAQIVPNEENTIRDRKTTSETTQEEQSVKKMIEKLESSRAAPEKKIIITKNSSSAFHPISSNVVTSRPPSIPRQRPPHLPPPHIDQDARWLPPAQKSSQTDNTASSTTIASEITTENEQRVKRLLEKFEPNSVRISFKPVKTSKTSQESVPVEKTSDDHFHQRNKVVSYESCQEAFKAIEKSILRSSLDYELRVEEAKKEYKRRHRSEISSGLEEQKIESQEAYKAIEKSISRYNLEYETRVEEAIKEHKIKQQLQTVISKPEVQKSRQTIIEKSTSRSQNLPKTPEKVEIIKKAETQKATTTKVSPKSKSPIHRLSSDIDSVHKSRRDWKAVKSNFMFDLIVKQSMEPTKRASLKQPAQERERNELRQMMAFFALNKLDEVFITPLITRSQQFTSFYRLAATNDLEDSIDKVLVCASIALRDMLVDYFKHRRFIVIMTLYDRISRNEPTIANKCLWDSALDERVCVVHYGDHICCIVHVYAINYY